MDPIRDWADQIRTWIVRSEPYRGPSPNRNPDRVQLRRVDQIEVGSARIKIPLPEPDHVEAKAMQVHRVILSGHRSSVLQHKLDICTVLQLHHPRAVHGRGVVRGVVRGSVDEVINP